MPPAQLEGAAAKELLLLEQRGALPDYAQRQLDTLRANGLAPPALPRDPAAAPAALTFRQELDTAARGVGGFAKETARTGALPTIGGLVGAGLGGALTLPFGATGAVPGEMIGSGLGEGANQLFGITEPSATQIGLAAAGGPLVRGVQGAYRAARPAIARNLIPGAAPVLHEIGQQTLERLPTQIGPGAMITDALWSQVDRLAPGAKVVTTNLDNAARDLQKIYGKSALFEPGSAEGKVLEKIQDLNQRHLNDVPFDVLDATRKDIGHLTRSTDDKIRTIGNKLYAAIERDYDAFQAMPGRPRALVTTLREARRAYLDDLLADRVKELIKPRYSGGTGGVRLTAATTMRLLRQDEFLTKHMTPQQLDLVERALDKIKGLPAFPPDRGVNYGSGRNAMTFLTGFGGATGLTGSPGKGALVGAGLTTMSWMITKIAMSEFGQKRLHAMINKAGGQIDPRWIVGLYNTVVAQRPGSGGD